MKTKQQRSIETTLRDAVTRPRESDSLTVSTSGRRLGLFRDNQSFRLAVDRIRPDADQVRRMNKSAADPDIKRLARSIDQQGLRNYPEVRWIEQDDIYELVSGERRFTAMTKVLDWQEIPVRVVEVPDDQIIWLQLHENVHRKDLHPLDLAAALQTAMDEQGLSLEQVARKLNKSKPLVQKALTIARQLSREAHQVFEDVTKPLGLDMIYQVATLQPEQQLKLAHQIVEEGLTYRQVAASAANEKKHRTPEQKARGGRRPQKSKPFTKAISVANRATVTVKFRKSNATADEVASVLTEALAAFKESTARAA